LPYVPQYSANMHATVVIFSAFGPLHWRTDFNYNGPIYGDHENRVRQKAVGLLHTALHWRSGKHQFHLWAKNLMDKKYYATLYAGRNAGYDWNLVNYGRSRTFGAAYQLQF